MIEPAGAAGLALNVNPFDTKMCFCTLLSVCGAIQQDFYMKNSVIAGIDSIMLDPRGSTTVSSPLPTDHETVTPDLALCVGFNISVLLEGSQRNANTRSMLNFTADII